MKYAVFCLSLSIAGCVRGQGTCKADEQSLRSTLDSRSYAVCDTVRTAVGNELVSGSESGYRREYRGQLVYRGRSGSVIHLTYREFGGEEGRTIRSGFALDMQYDLGKSDQITFRSLTLDILEATNDSIKFVVLRDAPEGWLGVGGAEKL